MVSGQIKTSPGVTFLKVILVIFTIILLIIGACLFGGGIYSKVQLSGYDLLTTKDYSPVPYAMIGIGVFVLLVGIFGCFAIAKNNTCMLRTYSVALGILFLAEFSFAIYIVVDRAEIQMSFETGTDKALANYKNDSSYRDALNSVQTTLDCCGSNNYTDYWSKAFFDENVLPQSCCLDGHCDKFPKNETLLTVTIPPANISSSIHPKGCPEKVFTAVNGNLGAILGCMFGVAGLQLVGVFLSCCLASTINKNKYELV